MGFFSVLDSETPKNGKCLTFVKSKITIDCRSFCMWNTTLKILQLLKNGNIYL